MLPQFKPVLALVIISGVAFGGETGFLVGAVTMLVSSILFSQGPWTPWQMFSMGITGLSMDLVHAAATVACLLLIAEPMLQKLDRIKVKYGMVE